MLPIDNGSIYQAGTSAVNIITQPAPTSGVWTVTAAVEVSALDQNYQQAGLRLYSDDDNWASVHMISAGGTRQFEFIYEAAGTPRNEAADHSDPLPANAPLAYFVRIHSDGTNITGQYSFDGDTWTNVGRPAPLSTFSNPGIGPVALSDQAPAKPTAYFDWIRFDPDSGSSGGGGGGGGTSAIVDEFNGTDVAAPPWEVVRRDQTMTVSRRRAAHPGPAGRRLPGHQHGQEPRRPRRAHGRLDGDHQGRVQGHRPVPPGGHHPARRRRQPREVRPHRRGRDRRGEVRVHPGGRAVARNDAADSTANIAASFPNDYYLRMVSDGTNVTGAYSTDGTTWTPVGRPAAIPAGAKIGVFAFSNAAATTPVADFDWFRLEGPAAPSGPSRDDDFSGTTLDKSRWNAILRENPAKYEVGGGNLTITTELGDIYTGDTNPPPPNFILQSADHAGADWVIETKLTGTITDGYAPGRPDRPRQRRQLRQARRDLRLRARRGSTASSCARRSPAAVQNPQPQVDVPAGTGNIWLRLTKTGTDYKGEYSFDGTTWTAFAAPVANTMTTPAFGLFAFGPQATAVGDTVSFDYFTLDGQDARRR